MKSGLSSAVAVLSRTEEGLLKEQEGVIEKGLNNFLEVGKALLTIRDKRLYRGEHGTFEEYCRTKWGFSKTAANRYISASNVNANLIEVDTEVLPTSEAQFRPLTMLKPLEQKKVWKRVVEEVRVNKRTLTANIITRKIGEVYPQQHKKMTTKPTPKSRRFTLEELEASFETALQRDIEKLKSASPKELSLWVRTVLASVFSAFLIPA
jgi:hypothetical protein